MMRGSTTHFADHQDVNVNIDDNHFAHQRRHKPRRNGCWCPSFSKTWIRILSLIVVALFPSHTPPSTKIVWSSHTPSAATARHPSQTVSTSVTSHPTTTPTYSTMVLSVATTIPSNASSFYLSSCPSPSLRIAPVFSLLTPSPSSSFESTSLSALCVSFVGWLSTVHRMLSSSREMTKHSTIEERELSTRDGDNKSVRIEALLKELGVAKHESQDKAIVLDCTALSGSSIKCCIFCLDANACLNVTIFMTRDQNIDALLCEQASSCNSVIKITGGRTSLVFVNDNQPFVGDSIVVCEDTSTRCYVDCQKNCANLDARCTVNSFCHIACKESAVCPSSNLPVINCEGGSDCSCTRSCGNTIVVTQRPTSSPARTPTRKLTTSLCVSRGDLAYHGAMRILKRLFGRQEKSFSIPRMCLKWRKKKHTLGEQLRGENSRLRHEQNAETDPMTKELAVKIKEIMSRMEADILKVHLAAKQLERVQAQVKRATNTDGKLDKLRLELPPQGSAFGVGDRTRKEDCGFGAEKSLWRGRFICLVMSAPLHHVVMLG